MSQAVLILAHKNIPYLIKLADKLLPAFKVFVHLDKNYPLSSTEKDELRSRSITLLQEHYVNWGAWSICASMISLLKNALEDPEITYFHFISGQDWPTLDADEIFSFYENNSSIYLLSSPAKGVRKTGERLELWQQFYFDYDKIPRQTLYGILYHRLSLLKQSLHRVDKLKDLSIELELYQGSQWADLPRDAAEYCVTFLSNNPNVAKMLQTGFCSDEFMLQTILCNSPLKGRIVNDNHRFIKPEKQHGSLPAILDISNYEEITSGNYHFARKIDERWSLELISALDKNSASKEESMAFSFQQKELGEKEP